MTLDTLKPEMHAAAIKPRKPMAILMSSEVMPMLAGVLLGVILGVVCLAGSLKCLGWLMSSADRLNDWGSFVFFVMGIALLWGASWYLLTRFIGKTPLVRGILIGLTMTFLLCLTFGMWFMTYFRD